MTPDKRRVAQLENLLKRVIYFAVNGQLLTPQNLLYADIIRALQKAEKAET